MAPLRTVPYALLLAVLPFAACRREEPQTPPRQKEAGTPFHYPEELWDAGVEGETLLRIFVGETGGVDTVRVEKSSGYAAFDSSAARGAREILFDPAHRGTVPVGAWVLLPVQFELPASDSTHGGPREVR
jgi:protein TonB